MADSIPNGTAPAQTNDVEMTDHTPAEPVESSDTFASQLERAASQPDTSSNGTTAQPAHPAPIASPAPRPPPSQVPAASTPPAAARPSSQPPQSLAPPDKPAAHGAPTRVYLNENVTPHLLEGMKYLAAYEPKQPLKWLSEFLAKKSAELEGS